MNSTVVSTTISTVVTATNSKKTAALPFASITSLASKPTDVVANMPAVLPTMTVEELVAYAVRLQPLQAARERDSRFCVTPLITAIIGKDGERIELDLVDGRYGAAYPRVSDEVQRSAASLETRVGNKRSKEQEAYAEKQESDQDPKNAEAMDARRPMHQADGFSEEEQLTRQIHHFIRHRQAFKIYSDCGITGEYPTDDPRLIARLLEAKARRYKKIFERTLLDETSLLRRTADEVASMRAYLDKRLDEILGSGGAGIGDTLEDVEAAEGTDAGDSKNEQKSGLTKTGRPRRAVYFRQAFTQLWKDIDASKIHVVVVSDRSRLCRAADLETAFLELLAKRNTRLVGLIEDLSSLDVSDPLKRGLTYLIASINEYRLEETAGHSLRGVLQLLESGRPNGRTPWWIKRDARGFAHLIPERAELVRRIVEMSLSGLGLRAISRRLHDEGVRLSGIKLTISTIAYTLSSDALIGTFHHFGLEWAVYPPVIGAETYAELKRVRGERDAPLSRLHDKRHWAEHLFTGVLFCSVCGGPMSYNPPSIADEAGGETGYYLCKAAHRTAAKKQNVQEPQDPQEPTAMSNTHHACLSGTKLAAFFDELLIGSPHLLRQALAGGDQRLASSAAQRQVAQEALRVARAEYEVREADARTRATDMAIQMARASGLETAGAGFEAIVDGIAKSLMEADAARIAGLEAQVVEAEANSREASQSSRALVAVDALSGWSGLDNLSKNRLLRALFTVTVHPMPRLTEEEKCNRQRRVKKKELPIRAEGTCGYLSLRLAGGGNVTLSPAWMRRGPGKGVRLPTMTEWIADTLADATASKEREECA